MSIEDKIFAEAEKTFDAVGVSAYGRDSLIILGLVTILERDLDDFWRDEEGAFRLRGFEIHARPKLDSLLHYIGELGQSAELVGWLGYPQGQVLNLKQQAVAAGIGKWGKNSLVLHHKYGPWLRFMAVMVKGIALPVIGPGRDNREMSQLCRDCNACIEACPAGIIAPYYLIDRYSCRAEVSTMAGDGKLVVCDRCLADCPAGRRE